MGNLLCSTVSNDRTSEASTKEQGAAGGEQCHLP